MESRSDGCTFASLRVPNRVESVRVAASFLMESAKNMRVPLASDSLFELAVVEALNNAVKHGNTGADTDAMIVCELELTGRRVTVRILDQGPGYALPAAPAPTGGSPDILAVPESGYGISIIQHVFPTVRTISRGDRFGLEMSLTV